jgi:hypothetical protein
MDSSPQGAHRRILVVRKLEMENIQARDPSLVEDRAVQRAFGLSVSLMIFAATAIRSAVPRNVRTLVALHVNTR